MVLGKTDGTGGHWDTGVTGGSDGQTYRWCWGHTGVAEDIQVVLGIYRWCWEGTGGSKVNGVARRWW